MVTSTRGGGTSLPGKETRSEAMSRGTGPGQYWRSHYTGEAVGAMNTERHAWSANQVVAIAEWRVSPICGCGQDLDVCAGTHCPRCGTSLTGHAA
jgi:hypothetical protein